MDNLELLKTVFGGDSNQKLDSSQVFDLFKSAITENNEFARDFNERVVRPMLKQLGAKIKLDDLVLDAKSIGKSMSASVVDAVSATDLSKAVARTLPKIVTDITYKVSDFQTSIIPGMSRAVKKNWTSLQEQILLKVGKAVRLTDFTFGSIVAGKKTISINDLFPTNKDSTIATTWMKIQRSVISKLQKANIVPDDAKPKTGFKSLLEQKPAYTISGFDPAAITQLKKLLTPANVKTSTIEAAPKTEPSWLTRLARAGIALLGGSLILGIGGLLDSGPLKGTAKLISKLGLQLGHTIVKSIGNLLVPKWLKTIGGTLLSTVSSVLSPILKLLTTVSSNVVSFVQKRLASITPFIVSSLDGLKKLFMSGLSKLKLPTIRGIVARVSGMVASLISTVSGSILSMFSPLTQGILKGVNAGGLKGSALKLGGRLLKVVKRIPIIGSVLSAGYAISRFRRGDYIGGLIDTISGIVALIPGLGLPLSLGLDVFNAYLDVKSGNSTENSQPRKVSVLKDIQNWFYRKLSPIIHYIPGVGMLKHASEAIGYISSGNIFQGLRSFVHSIGNVAPGLGLSLSSGLAWVTDLNNISRDQPTTPTTARVSFYNTLKDYFKDKLIKLFKNASPWLRWVLKRVPGTSGIFSGIDDIELLPDLSLEERVARQDQIDIESYRKRIDYEKSRITRSAAGENEYMFSDKRGVESSISKIQELEKKVRELESKQTDKISTTKANDFIWRAGEKIQPFNSNDNLISVKDSKAFKELTDVLKQNTSNASKVSIDISPVTKGLDRIHNSISELTNTTRAANMQQSSIQSNPDYSTNNVSDGTRDPAYLLRSRVWDRIKPIHILV